MLEYFDTSTEQLLLGGIGVTELAEEFGTPLYVYDLGIIKQKYDKVKGAFPDFDIFYSVKANSNLAVSSYLEKLGAGAELASEGELHLMLQAGFAPENIIFAGPGKTPAELEYAIRTGIYAINVESATELRRIDGVSQRLGVRTQVGLRVNTGLGVDSAAEKMVGGPSKFGFDEEDLVEEIRALDLKNVDIVGLHVYTASGVLSTEALFANFDRTVGLAARYSRELGFDLKFIDFGGGFGVPYFEGESELDIESLGRMVAKRLDSADCPIDKRHTRLIWELGRYLVAECGVYITRVVDVKDSRGKTYVITDGGMNQMIRPVFMDLNHPTLLVNKLNASGNKVVDVGGPCCTPIDMLAKGIELPRPELGDLVGIFNAGAYGFSMSMLYFLSHPLPAEIIIINGQALVSRIRGSVRDSMINQVPLELHCGR